MQALPTRLLDGVRMLRQNLSAPSAGARQAGKPSALARVAVIDASRCLAWGGTECQACYLSCPRREDAFLFYDGRPAIIAGGCDGCGACVEACRSVNDLGAMQLAEVLPAADASAQPIGRS